MWPRWLVAMLAAAFVSIALSACWISGSGAKSGGKAVEALLPTASRAFHWVGAIAPAGGTLSTAASGLGDAIDRGTGIKAQYQIIVASDDPFGEALVSATCYGLSNIANQSRQNTQLLPPSAQGWEEFLKTEVGKILKNTPAATITRKVTEFNNAAQLEMINPRVAYVYVKECVLRAG